MQPHAPALTFLTPPTPNPTRTRRANAHSRQPTHCETPAPTGAPRSPARRRALQHLLALAAALPHPRTHAAIDGPELGGLADPPDSQPPFRDIGSGVLAQEVTPGSGAPVSDGSMVSVRYVLRRANGYFVDASYGFDRFETFSFRAGSGEVVRGFDIAVRGMREGGRRRFVVPPALGYVRGVGRGAPGPVPPGFGGKRSLAAHAGERLVFEVLVVKVTAIIIGVCFVRISASARIPLNAALPAQSLSDFAMPPKPPFPAPAAALRAALRRLCTAPPQPHLSHLDSSGRAKMVDVSAKPHTARTARATAHVTLGRPIYNLLRESMTQHGSARSQKGDVFATAQLAGVLAAKQTASLIPLCHSVPLAHVGVDLALDEEAPGVRITASARTAGQTGVEMEALTAASVAALTVYDMCKAGGKGIVIGPVRLEEKRGGVGGDFRRGEE